MKFFFLINLIAAFLLAFTRPFSLHGASYKPQLPKLLVSQKTAFIESFHTPTYAQAVWSYSTGDKIKLPARVNADFNKLQIGYLFSPSGIHLAGLLFFAYFLFKKIKRARIFLLLILYWLPYLAIKRLIMFRLLFLLKNKFNLPFSVEHLFLLTFFLAFIFGHYHHSALSFILSFLYMGTYISLRNETRINCLLGLLASHLLVAFFSLQELSPIALLLQLPLLTYFSALLPMSYLYLITFKIFSFNWLEPFVRFFLINIHWMAKIAHLNSINSSFFLILFVWMILIKQNKMAIAFFLFLHTNTLQCPAVFYNSKDDFVSRSSEAKLN